MSRVMFTDRDAGCERWSIPDLEGHAGAAAKAHPNAAPETPHSERPGYEQGFEAGRLEGLEAGREELQQRLVQLQQLMTALTRPFAELDAEVEAELVALVLAIVRRLVPVELETGPQAIAAVIRETLSLLPGAERDISLVLHPDDAQLIEELMPAASRENTWRIIEDTSMVRGGCVVKTRTSQIDASVEARLDNIIASFFNADTSEDPQV